VNGLAKKKEFSVKDVKVMPLEERYDRALDYFTLDHAVSCATHKKLGTIDQWVDDTIEAYRKMMPRFMGPLAKVMGKLAPGMSLRQAFNHVVYAEQQMHDLSEFEITQPSDSELCVRFRGCDRLRRQRETVKKAGLDIDPRYICEVEKMHHFHPRHPMRDSGITPVSCEWEETGCVWHFKQKR
jgi:hypothetical protein